MRRPIWRCACGFVYAGRVAGEDLAAAYDEGYYRGGVYADYLADRAAIHRNAARSLAELEADVAGRRLLDVGCAGGFFLEKARQRGWTVAGLEISAYAAAHARTALGLDVAEIPITGVPADRGPFDAITLWDVVEHLDDPRGALRAARALLAPGGRLVISTGDVQSRLCRLTGARWRLYSDPTHLWFFDEGSLTRLLTEEGFRVLRTHRKGKHVSVAMGLHQSPLPGARILARALARTGWPLLVYVNLGDVMTLVAAPA